MYEISTEASFSAAHHLKNYNGPCENIHGHNWRIRATVRCNALDSSGLGIDFKILKQNLKLILEKLDHTDLNCIFEPLNLNPSSENMAQYIYNELKQKLSTYSCQIHRVEVYETPDNCAAYFENNESN